jgi:hypothetical protein
MEITKIINNKVVANAFFNLYDRWRDESEYEDINDYGKSLAKTIAKEFPNEDIKFVSATKRPFGVKVSVSGKVVHLFTKMKGRYIVLCAKG